LSPCKTFQQAVYVVAVGGEVTAIDSAGFGPITIIHAVTITSPNGVEAGIVPVSGGNSITIDANPGDDVTLQGLTLDGGGVGQNGIVFNSGGSLTVRNCVVRNNTNNGIVFGPNASSNLVMSDTFVANNKGGNGIAVVPSGSGTVTAVFNRVEADSNGDGILLDAASYYGPALNVTAAESVVTGNSGDGFYLNCFGNLMIVHSVIANNNTGFEVQSGCVGIPTLWIGQSTVTENTNGWLTAGSGVVLSYGDNKIDGNASNEGKPPSIGNK